MKSLLPKLYRGDILRLGRLLDQDLSIWLEVTERYTQTQDYMK